MFQYIFCLAASVGVGLASSAIARDQTAEQVKIDRFQQDIVQLENEVQHLKDEISFMQKSSVQRINEDKCNKLLISGHHPIPDAKMSASTSWDAYHTAPRARLYRTDYNRATPTLGVWCAKVSNQNQWLEFDLGDVRTVHGVVTKGRGNIENFVKSFKIYYGSRKSERHVYKDLAGNDKVFEGNFDGETVKVNVLDPPIEAQYIRINPQTWHIHISMRADLLGCE